MICKYRHFHYHYLANQFYKISVYTNIIDKYLRIGNYRFIIRGEYRHKFYDI